jgi:hypothetical protein
MWLWVYAPRDRLANEFHIEAPRPARVAIDSAEHRAADLDTAERAIRVIPAPGARVRLITPHAAGPLLAAHRRGTAVGQEVDDDLLGRDLEKVEARPAQDRLALLGRRELELKLVNPLGCNSL